MMKQYLIFLIFLTFFALNGLAETKNIGGNEISNKIHLQNVIAMIQEHAPSLNDSKENMKLRFRRDDPDIKTFLAQNEVPHHHILQNYVAQHAHKHRGGDRKPSVDFDTVLKETVPYNSTDYS